MTLMASSSRPAHCKDVKMVSCGTDPKALVRSSQATDHCRLERRTSTMVDCRAKLCSQHPSTGMNPFWLVLIRSLRTAHRPRRPANTEA